MADEVTKCERCDLFLKSLKQKEEEIEILKYQLEKLKNYFHVNKYNADLEELGITTFAERNDPENFRESVTNECALSSGKQAQNFSFMQNTGKTKTSKLKNVETQTVTNITFYKGSSAGIANGDNCQPCESSICTAEKVVSEDYVYDENSKMYYNYSTGYYYDDKNCFFYEPKSGTCYKYDFDKQEYELVSKNSTAGNGYLCNNFVDKVNCLSIDDSHVQSTGKDCSSEKFDEAASQNIVTSSDIEDIKDDDYNVFEKLEEPENFNGSANDWKLPEGSDITVCDLVKEVANQHSGMSDYIYDESSHMYYSPSTGYYYDAVKKVLFDPSSGIYYLYDSEKQTYEFYYQIENYKAGEDNNRKFQTDTTKSRLKCRKAYWKNKLEFHKSPSEALPVKKSDIEDDDDASEEFSSPEDGEIFSSDTESEDSFPPKILDSTEVVPSCIRAIVESSEKMKIGTLLLITCTGGIIGREKNNAVYIPDTNVSKLHAKIGYDSKTWKYSIEDMGSQNGTFINEERLSEPKEKSKAHVLNHGDKLSLGSCKLLIHIHSGLETCDKCEPGQVLAGLASEKTKEVVYKTKEEKEKERRQELQRLKKKYGLGNMAYEVKSSIAVEYEDKAEIRRQTVGSENPYEKTVESSIHDFIPDSNKGYKILKKMGWKEGENLGVNPSGILEPVQFRPWNSKAGLGSTDEMASVQSVPENRRRKKWVKAQERYFQLS